MQPIILILHLMIKAIKMNNKLLYERMKWGTAIAMGLALSMITSKEEIKESISNQVIIHYQVCQEEIDHNSSYFFKVTFQ